MKISEKKISAARICTSVSAWWATKLQVSNMLLKHRILVADSFRF